MEDRQDRRPVALVEVDEELHDLHLVPQVEVDRRLVEQEDRRRLGDGHRQQDELPFAQRQLPGIAPQEVADASSLDRRGDGGAVCRTVAAHRILVRDAAEPDDLLDRHRERQTGRARHDRQPPGDRAPVEPRDRPPGELDRMIEAAGGDTNAATWVDWTYYRDNLPKEELALVVDLEADRMAHLVLGDKQVESEREVVANERRFRVEDDVDGFLSEELYKLAFTTHPYHWPTIGWMREVSIQCGGGLPHSFTS